MVGATDRVLVVLDDDERVAFRLELRERVEQHAVVARMQADRRLVEDVADAAQIRSELGGQANALRLAAGERRRRAVEREIGETDVAEKGEPRRNFADDVARDVGFAPAQIELGDEARCIADGELRQLGDRAAAKAHGERVAVEARAVAVGTGLVGVFVPFVPPDLVAGLLGIEAAQLRPGAEAGRAPAVLRVEREQPRVELGIAAVARRTRALGREHFGGRRRRPPLRLRVQRRVDFGGRSVSRASTWTTPLPYSSARASAARSAGSFSAATDDLRDRQLDRVLLEPIEPRPALRRQHLAVDAQLGEALARRPLREVGVVALARDDERREQRDALPRVVAHQPHRDALLALRRDRRVVVGAVLRAELHVEEPQEMVDLGQRRDGALAPAAARALLDRDGRRDAEDRVDVGTRRRLHELARVGVQRFEVAALALGEQDVERERALAAARDAGHDGEAVARNRDVDVLQVVLARVVDADRVGAAGCARRLAQRMHGGRRERRRAERGFVRLQRGARMRSRARDRIARRCRRRPRARPPRRLRVRGR